MSGHPSAFEQMARFPTCFGEATVAWLENREKRTPTEESLLRLWKVELSRRGGRHGVVADSDGQIEGDCGSVGGVDCGASVVSAGETGFGSDHGRVVET